MINTPIILPGDKVCVVFPASVGPAQDGENLTQILETTYPGVEFEVGTAEVPIPLIAWIYRDPEGYHTWHKDQRTQDASQVVGVTPVPYAAPPQNFDGDPAL